MRTLICSAIAATLLITAAPAQAADGCSFGAGGQLYCQPGAQPGVPYYRDGYYGGDPYYGGSYYRNRDYDPGPAIALGILGAAAGAIASQPRYKHRRRHRH